MRNLSATAELLPVKNDSEVASEAPASIPYNPAYPSPTARPV